MILLIDNSNRTTKLALGSTAGISEDWQCRLPSAGLTVDDVAEAVRDWSVVESVAFCSVTEAGPALLRAMAADRGLPCLGLTAACVPLDLSRYPEPGTIGSDRLADAVAAAALFPGRTVVAIDAGTAVTFNGVAPGRGHPVFLGGAIAPGLAVFSTWLHEATDRLPAIEFPCGPPDPAIADSTVGAMRTAAWHGCAGMLNGLLESLCAGLDDPAVAITGSDAGLVRSLLRRPATHAPWLTLDGVRRTALAAAGPTSVGQA